MLLEGSTTGLQSTAVMSVPNYFLWFNVLQVIVKAWARGIWSIYFTEPEGRRPRGRVQ